MMNKIERIMKMIVQKKCKNKKCNKVLPKNSKSKYCENCLNKRADLTKMGAKTVLGSIGCYIAHSAIKDHFFKK